MDIFWRIVGHPFFWFIAAGAILQGLGKLGANAARKLAEQQEAQKRTGRPVRPPRPPRPIEPAQQTTQPDRPSPDQIARQIREMMGMEEAAPPPARPPQPPPSEPARSSFEHVEATSPVSGTGRAQAPGPFVVVTGQPEPVVQDAGIRSVAATRPIGARAQGRLLDIRDPAAAMVAMAVFGPPRAMQGWE